MNPIITDMHAKSSFALPFVLSRNFICFFNLYFTVSAHYKLVQGTTLQVLSQRYKEFVLYFLFVVIFYLPMEFNPFDPRSAKRSVFGGFRQAALCLSRRIWNYKISFSFDDLSDINCCFFLTVAPLTFSFRAPKLRPFSSSGWYITPSNTQMYRPGSTVS